MKAHILAIIVSMLLFGAGCARSVVQEPPQSPVQTPSAKAVQQTPPQPPSPAAPIPAPVLTHTPTSSPTPMPPKPTTPPPTLPFTLSSSAFSNGGTIPSEYTCDGKDGSPPLAWHGAPEGTKSFTLIVDDPDAPGDTWVHWTLWNIAPATTSISARSVPSGATQGMTSFGKPGYGGPCPPSGVHRYFFKLYALDLAQLNLPASTTAHSVEAAMQGHIIKKTQLMAKYSAK